MSMSSLFENLCHICDKYYALYVFRGYDVDDVGMMTVYIREFQFVEDNINIEHQQDNICRHF